MSLLALFPAQMEEGEEEEEEDEEEEQEEQEEEVAKRCFLSHPCSSRI